MTNLLRAAARSMMAPPAPYDDFHVFQGNQYWNNVMSSWDPGHEGIGADFAGLVNRAYKGNPIVFACEHTRVALVSQARPKWRNKDRRTLYGTPDLAILENPWPGGRFKQLASRMVLNADLGGTAFVARRRERPDRLMLLRPDWCSIVLGSQDEPDHASWAMDADYLGVMYQPGGQASGATPIPLLADECAVWAPNPDPSAAYRGMSWLPSAGREVDADVAASAHKLAFFENGATPQLIISFGPEVSEPNFAKFVRKLEMNNTGVRNAYKTLAVGAGATPHVVGKDLKQLDFKTTQGAGETRIAAASGVHPVVAALSEGMAGSSLNAGNFRAACRLVADRTLRDLWDSMFAALETIVPPPDPGSELSYDERAIPFLQEDRKDAADIAFLKAQTVTTYVREGFTAESAVQAVEAEDPRLLVHSGLVSVQLQPPGVQKPTIDGSTGGAQPVGGRTPRPAIAAGGSQ